MGPAPFYTSENVGYYIIYLLNEQEFPSINCHNLNKWHYTAIHT